MTNPEFEKSKHKDETGYSEKEQALAIEIKAGEWQNLKKFNSHLKSSKRKKKVVK